MMPWTRLGSMCPPRLVLLCTALCVFTMVTYLSTVCGYTTGTESSLWNTIWSTWSEYQYYRKIVLHHIKETVYYINGLIAFRYSYECMTSYWHHVNKTTSSCTFDVRYYTKNTYCGSYTSQSSNFCCFIAAKKFSYWSKLCTTVFFIKISVRNTWGKFQ